MMKKLMSLILIAVMLMETSCSSSTSENANEGGQQDNMVAPAPDNDPGSQINKDVTWPLADGIWIYEYNGAYEFINMSVYEGENCYTDGFLFSGVVDGGPISNLAETQKGIYEFTVNVPAVPENDMDSGHDAFSYQVKCDTSRMNEGVLLIGYNGEEPLEFFYIAESLEDIDYSQVYGG